MKLKCKNPRSRVRYRKAEKENPKDYDTLEIASLLPYSNTVIAKLGNLLIIDGKIIDSQDNNQSLDTEKSNN